MHVIEFAPPMEGFDDEFNTIRPALSWSKRVKRGDTVLLVDKRVSAVFAAAKVTAIHTGRLFDIAKEHAHLNHNQINHSAEGAAERLLANMHRRYGPRIVTESRHATVIYLKRKTP